MGTKKDSTIYDVAIYCRLSREDVKEDGSGDESASIGTQKAILTDYVRQRGWHLVQTYVDDGYSGTNFQRPGFQSMIQGFSDFCTIRCAGDGIRFHAGDSDIFLKGTDHLILLQQNCFIQSHR